jgi:hypothetical protein
MSRAGRLVALAALAMAGCASTVRLEVRPAEKSNGGRPLYMMVREVPAGGARAEEYESIAAKAFKYPPDPSVRKMQVVFPNRPLQLELQRPEDGALEVYFFFTRPGANWSVPLAQPLPAEVLIELGEDEIARVQVKRR